jgi:hypothetical protein
MKRDVRVHGPDLNRARRYTSVLTDHRVESKVKGEGTADDDWVMDDSQDYRITIQCSVGCSSSA